MNDWIKFWVPGDPKPQGSKTAYLNKHTGRAVLVESCKLNKPWRERAKAIAEMNYQGMPITTALEMSIGFFFRRPKSHYGTGQNSKTLKASAPDYMATQPDIDKTTRSILDALKDVIYKDDSLVCHLSVCKLYATIHGPGAQVCVRAITHTAGAARESK